MATDVRSAAALTEANARRLFRVSRELVSLDMVIIIYTQSQVVGVES